MRSPVLGQLLSPLHQRLEPIPRLPIFAMLSGCISRFFSGPTISDSTSGQQRRPTLSALGDPRANPRRGPLHGGELRQAAGTVAAEGLKLPYTAPSIEPIVETEATPDGQRPLVGENACSSKAQGRKADANVA